MSQKQESNYTEASITILDGVQAVRRRPGMYIGTTGRRGLHHLIFEIVDNSIDEAMGGYCDEITVRLLADGHVLVQDNGRGIPYGPHPSDPSVSTLEILLTRLHSGGKFDHDSYKVSGGLHGVGMAVVNSLSDHFSVEVHKDGKKVRQDYSKGIPQTGVADLGSSEKHGSIIMFKPDPEIFKEEDYCDEDGIIRFNRESVEARLKEHSFLNANVKIKFIDEQDIDNPYETEYHYQNGVTQYCEELIRDENPIAEVISLSGEISNTYIDMAFTWVLSDYELVLSFVNSINTSGGGTHVSGFRGGLTRSINVIASSKESKDQNILKNKVFKDKAAKGESVFSGEDCRYGILCILSVKVVEPQFEGQTKNKLGNSDVEGIVASFLYDKLKDYLTGQPDEKKKIIQRIEEAALLRIRLQNLREADKKRKGVGSGKLIDCTSKDPAKRELLLVEGESAGGSVIQGRKAETQAVLKLRGKVINVEKATTPEKMIKVNMNKEINEIINALGTEPKENFKPEDLKYHKVILLMDADVDGGHIKTLLLTFFYRFYPELIDMGYLYVAVPPLYRVAMGKEAHYVNSEAELREFRETKGKNRKLSISRFKGLGEMDWQEIRETTLSEENRILYQITKEDAVVAEQMVQMLMGEETDGRKKYILQYANKVKELDV
ncbi:MAG: DNA gyrase subunit B [Candidatus Heimdallarchaeota archaeon LC_3]|nr:MAG: DNA gyrase subunit B [Candidatus Heimdallarchaeota archaeon LC_3]